MRDYDSDRSVPTLITLVVIAFLLMTFDVRGQGGGLIGTFRDGASRLLEPIQSGVAVVVDPIVAVADNLADVATLRAENEAYRAQIAELKAELARVDEERARLDVLEQIFKLQIEDDQLNRTYANIIGWHGVLDPSFQLNKGVESGILAGHPVLDENGYLVGRVSSAWPGGSIVVPLIGSREGVTVTAGDQVGSLSSFVGSDILTLEILEARGALRRGQIISTSTLSIAYPPSVPVGEVVDDAFENGGILTARVQPFVDIRRIRVVQVIAWPPDPVSAAEDDIPDLEGAP